METTTRLSPLLMAGLLACGLGCAPPAPTCTQACTDAGSGSGSGSGSGALVSQLPRATWASTGGTCGDGGWCFENPALGAPLLLRVWSAARDDAWAAGHGGLLHWDGVRWGRVATPFSQAELGAVHGSGPHDVWVAAKSAAHHWDGSHWSSHPIVPGAFDPPRGIWMASAQDGWMLGGYPPLQRWNGVAWLKDASFGTHTVYAISGSGPSDVWAVGDSGKIFHFDGAGWAEVGSGTTDLLFDVWVAARGDVWAVGLGGVRHFDGSTWSSVDTKPATGVFAISGRAPNDVWVSGYAGHLGHFDGTTWTSVTYDSPAVLRGLAPSGGGGMWAVGEGGTVLSVSPTASTAMTAGSAIELDGIWASSPSDVWIVGKDSSLIRFDGATWRSFRLGTDFVGASLTAISGTGANDVWICGSRNVLHWDGSGWRVAHPAIGLDATDIWAQAPDDVWLAAGGAISHWDGATWTAAQLPAPAWGVGGYKSVHGTGAHDVWAVGGGGSIAHYDGTLWKKVEAGTAARLNKVWASGPDAVWAVGDAAIRWQGTAWEATAPLPPTMTTSLSVRGSGPSDVWVTGWVGLSHWDGAKWTSWNAGDLGAGGTINAVWSTGGVVYAVGAGGAILRR